MTFSRQVITKGMGWASFSCLLYLVLGLLVRNVSAITCGSSCKTCEAGYWSSTTTSGSWNDPLCSGGAYYEDMTGYDTSGSSYKQIRGCCRCEKGKFLNIDDVSSYNIDGYKHKQTSCTGCPSGFVATSFGKPSCTKCPTGKTAKWDQKSCENCAAGKYNDVKGSDCKSCPSGKYAPTPGSSGTSDCTSCIPGYINIKVSTSDGFECSVCDAGKYNDSPSSSFSDQCQDCVTGRYLTDAALDGSEHNAASKCLACPIGYTSLDTRARCEICGFSKYQDEEGENNCKVCPANSFITDDKQEFINHDAYADCVNCTSGKFAKHGLEEIARYCDSCSAGKQFDDTHDECTNCIPGKYSSTITGGTCDDCPEGYYQPKPAMPFCLPCIPGKFQNNVASSECKACAVDFFSEDLRSSNPCSSCPSGYSTNSRMNQTLCNSVPPGNDADGECPMGFFCKGASAAKQKCNKGWYASSIGTVNCIECSAGKFAEKRGSIGCENCPMGWFQEHTNASTCEECVAGKKSHLKGSTGCLECQAGKYTRLSAQISCKDCSIGQYRDSNMANRTICAPCQQGKYNPTNGSSLCLPCVPTQYQDQRGAASCKTCPVNTFSNDTELKECFRCPLGKRAKEKSAACESCAAGEFGASCSKCTVGKYREGGADNDAATCDMCPAGWHQNTNGSSACLRCSPGKAQPSQGTEKCIPCLAGKFLESAAADPPRTLCKECITGKYQLEPGSSGCLDCLPGKFQDEIGQGTDACKNCVEGKYQGDSGKTTCYSKEEGKVVDEKRSSQSLIPEGSQIICVDKRCTTFEACRPGKHGTKNRQSCTNCSTGKYSFKGALTCQKCDKAKYASSEGSSSCTPCEKKQRRYSDTAGSSDCKICKAGMVSIGDECQNAAINNDLAQPDGVIVELVQQQHWASIHITWTTGTNGTQPETYDVQLSHSKEFPAEEGKTVQHSRITSKTVILSLKKPSWKSVTFVRVRGVGNNTNEASQWSLVSEKWNIAEDCDVRTQYLNTTSTFPTAWMCNSCPRGADCKSKSMLYNLFPKPNHWRVPWAPPNDQFERCPFNGDCLVNISDTTGGANGTDGCVNGTTGPLCAVCQPGFIRRTHCVVCTNADVAARVAGVSIMFLIFIILLCTQRQRLRRLHRKYGALWRDIVRIVTINISFMQINASLPSMLDIEWPESYLAFLAEVDFVNLDVLTVLGMPCVTPMDFRVSVAVAGLAPLCIALVAFFMYCHRRLNARKAAKIVVHDSVLKREAAQYLFDVLDVEESQSIDVSEFQHLLIFLGHRHSSKKHATKIMQTVLEHTAGAHCRGNQELTRDQFLNAITSGEIEGLTHTGNKWVEVVERERVFTSYLAGVLLIFFLIHAPVSQRVFYYFDHHDVKSRYINYNPNQSDQQWSSGKYLRSDYSIEYETGKWEAFLPVTLIILLLFVLGFPLIIIMVLFKNRHHLHSAHNRRRLGFIYKPFVRGAEFWELHEVFRKMMLTSILIFIPATTRTAVAILICVVTVASLNYVRPHKNAVVFWVAETSFVLTAFKYLTSIFIFTQQVDGAYASSKESLGWVLIGLDASMMVGSVVAMIAVGVLLKKAKKMMLEDESAAGNGGAKRDPPPQLVLNSLQQKNSSAAIVPLRKKSAWNLSEADIRKAAHHAKAERTEIEAEQAHNRAVKEIELHKALATTRLQHRLLKRKKTLQSKLPKLSMAKIGEMKEDRNKEKKTAEI